MDLKVLKKKVSGPFTSYESNLAYERAQWGKGVYESGVKDGLLSLTK